jgi:hypothetical protein
MTDTAPATPLDDVKEHAIKACTCSPATVV